MRFGYELGVPEAERNNPNPRFSTLWAGLNNTTTAHGIPRLRRYEGGTKKIIWLAVLMGCFVMVTYNTTTVFMDYFQFDVNVDVKMVPNVELPFPTVTICNMTPINRLALEQFTGLDHLKDVLESTAKKRAASGTTTATPSTHTTTNYTSSTHAQTTIKDTIATNIELREEFVAQERVIQALSELPLEKKEGIGFTAAGMILDCQHAGRGCSHSDFETFYNPIHGNCYVFNSGWNTSKPVLWSKQTGVRYGLHLTLDIHQDQYVSSIGKSAGVRVLINDQYQMPFPDEDSQYAPPGYLTAFGLKKIGITRQPAPYGDCTIPEVRNISRSVYEEHYPVHYTTVSCMKTCYQHHVMEKCDCADPYVEKYGAAFHYRNLSSCDVRNTTQFACRETFIKLYTDGNLKCNCPQACRHTMFVPTITNAVWPSEVAKVDIVSKDAPQYVNDTSKIHENLLKLEIFYNDFNFEEISEKPAYTWEKLIGDLGGSFGLWIGWSILTFFEFIELLADFTVLSLMKFSRDSKKNKISGHQKPEKADSQLKNSCLNTQAVPGGAQLSKQETPAKCKTTLHGQNVIMNADVTSSHYGVNPYSSKQTLLSNNTQYSCLSSYPVTSESGNNVEFRDDLSVSGTSSHIRKTKNHPLLYV